MAQKYKAIHNSELDDFQKTCEQFGFKEHDFELKEHDYVQIPPDSLIFTYNAKVTITRKDIIRTYDTGNGTHWVADFQIDLENNVFPH